MAWAGEARRAALLALAVLIAGAAAARADWRESYKKGIEAFDRKEWSEVERWMREALDDQSQEGDPVKIYGVRFEPYLPHYYLGMALYQSGNCEGALAQWEASERQGAVQKTARYKTLTQNRDTCRQRLAKAPPPPPAPPAEAKPTEAEIQKAAAEAETQRKREREKEEADRLAQAQREAEERRKREEAAAEAARLAEAARAEEARLAEQARIAEENRIAEDNRQKAQHQDLARQIDRAAADARKILDQAGKVPNASPDLTRRRNSLRDLLRRAGAVNDGSPAADLERLRDQLSSAMATLEEAVLQAEGDKGPPAELRAAARAFFRADYAEVVRRLGSATFADRRATLTRHLLLAAARYSLWALGGEKDARLREQIVESIRACRRIDPKLVPDAKVFSPRFASFYKTAG